MKHTPGPWEAEGWDEQTIAVWNVRDDEYQWCIASVPNDIGDAAANAHMIAAAPDMYEALRAINEKAASVLPEATGGEYAGLRAFIETLVASTLAKAEGK